MQDLAPEAWLDRCAYRIVEIDPDIEPEEAKRIAQEIQAVERMRVMAPEAAADFVASEIGHSSERPRFERRAKPRG